MLIKIDENEEKNLNDGVNILKERIKRKKQELDALNEQIEEYNKLQDELNKLEEEIKVTKSRLDDIIRENI